MITVTAVNGLGFYGTRKYSAVLLMVYMLIVFILALMMLPFSIMCAVSACV